MEKIKLQSIYKKYENQDQYVIEDLNLSIHEDEFLVLVGSSGSGKSTVLRMIAGLETITEGELWIDGELNNDRPPKDRDIAMVFQNYALFPHMNVYENIEYGMKVRGVDSKIRKEKVEEVAEILGLTPYLERKPKELSGGQQQRVAVGRALVRDAGIFLMDEPLSNLDAKLRTQMREEIIHLHRAIDATFIYVTHDQAEAMTMADRIVVMEEGQIMQVGSPEEIYNHPANAFVAGFMGSPKMNLIDAALEDGKIILTSGQVIPVPANNLKDQAIIFGIRPEDISLVSEDEADFTANVDYIELTGADSYIHTKQANQNLTIRCKASQPVESGQPIYLKLDQKKIHIFNKETGQALRA